MSLILLALAGCSGSEDPVAPDETSLRVTTTPATARFSSLGEVIFLDATVTTGGGSRATPVSLAWSSSDTSVVMVDNSGQARALSNGSATLRVTAGWRGESAEAVIAAVVKQTSDSIWVSVDSLVLGTGSGVRIEAESFDANGYPLDDFEPLWGTTDPSIITINSGWASATGPGTGFVEVYSPTSSRRIPVRSYLAELRIRSDTAVGGRYVLGGLTIDEGVTVDVPESFSATVVGDVRFLQNGGLRAWCTKVDLQAGGDLIFEGGYINSLCSYRDFTGHPLRVQVMGEVRVRGDLGSSGDLTLSNAPPYTPELLAATGGVTAAGPGDCHFNGAALVSERYFVSSALDYGNWLRVTCRGAGLFEGFVQLESHEGRPGGPGEPGQPGGEVLVRILGGDAVFRQGGSAGTLIRPGWGGDGGDAEGTIGAVGGDGGAGGRATFEVPAGSITLIGERALMIRPSLGGKGGDAVSRASDGRQATAVLPAGAAGSTRSQGGKGGDGGEVRIPLTSAQLANVHVYPIDVSSGGGGGGARGEGGVGADGAATFPDAGAGGSVEALGGAGGRSALLLLPGDTVQLLLPGTGGTADVSGAVGGMGASRCPDQPAGAGGDGGLVLARPGAGGPGPTSLGSTGQVVVHPGTGSGGAGGAGGPPGAGGAPGVADLPGPIPMDAFLPGAGGAACNGG